MWLLHSKHKDLAEARAVADWLIKDNPNYAARVRATGRTWAVEQSRVYNG